MEVEIELTGGGKERRDEHKEDVVDEERAEQHETDLEGGQPKRSQLIDAEGNAKNVLEEPGMRRGVTDGEPGDGQANGKGH